MKINYNDSVDEYFGFIVNSEGELHDFSGFSKVSRDIISRLFKGMVGDDDEDEDEGDN